MMYIFHDFNFHSDIHNKKQLNKKASARKRIYIAFNLYKKRVLLFRIIEVLMQVNCSFFQLPIL